MTKTQQLLNEALDALEDMVGHHCGRQGKIDSDCLSANLEAMQVLEEHSRLDIEMAVGRRAIGKWPEPRKLRHVSTGGPSGCERPRVLLAPVTEGVWIIDIDFNNRMELHGELWEDDDFSLYFEDVEERVIEVGFRSNKQGMLIGVMQKKAYRGTFYHDDVYHRIMEPVIEIGGEDAEVSSGE